jgi:hypothetical protein
MLAQLQLGGGQRNVPIQDSDEDSVQIQRLTVEREMLMQVLGLAIALKPS